MKRKIFSLLALVMSVMTASAYELNAVTSEQGSISFTVGETTNATTAEEGQTVTVIITPSTGWVVNQPSGTWYAAVAATRTDIDLLKDVTLTFDSEDATTKAKTYHFTMARANVEISSTYKKLLTNSDITIENITALTYTGSALQPGVTVKDGSTPLVQGTDYTVSYSNNVNAALSTATQNAPTVTVTAVSTSEKYAGTTSKTFTINKAAGSISYSMASVGKTFGDPAFTNELTVVGDGTLGYASDNASVATVNPTTGEVTIVGSGDANITATVADKEGGNYTYATTTASYALGVGTATMTVGSDGFSGTYDEKAHGITVTAPEGATVKYGTASGTYDLTESPTYTDAGAYTVYYQVTKPNFTTVSAFAVVYIDQAAGTLSYATTSVAKAFGDPDFTNELTFTGDGFVSYASSNESVATVDAMTGEVIIVGAGEATITAIVEDGKNYLYATTSASYKLTVGTTGMTVTAEGFTGTYDEKAHGITVTAPEGATVKYGTAADSYELTENPTYTDAGEYTVYYQVTKEGFTTVTGSAVVTISQAAGSLSYATTAVSKKAEDEAFTNALTITGDGTVTYASSDEQVATVDETGKVTIVGAGQATITATVADGKNYSYATKTASYRLGVDMEPAGPTIDVDATNAENGSQEVNNVKMEMAIDESRETTQTEIIVVNPETGAEETRTVTVVPIILENIVIPAQTDATATDKKELTVTIPGSQLSADGQTLYLVTGIKKGALKSNEPTAVVTGVILPELAMPLDIEEGALKTDDGGSMTVISPLALLDDYAVMPVLQDNLKDGKLEALVEAPARYWTLACGVDVQVPEGVKVYKCCLSDDGKRVVTKQLSKEVLGGIIKANNGVMILGEKGSSYTVVAQYNQGITKVATTDAKSYGDDNLLTPVIEALHFEAGQVLVLKDDQWHPIKADEKLTPACKAVLVMPKAQTADENKDNNNEN